MKLILLSVGNDTSIRKDCVDWTIKYTNVIPLVARMYVFFIVADCNRINIFFLHDDIVLEN